MVESYAFKTQSHPCVYFGCVDMVHPVVSFYLRSRQEGEIEKAEHIA